MLNFCIKHFNKNGLRVWLKNLLAGIRPSCNGSPYAIADISELFVKFISVS